MGKLRHSQKNYTNKFSLFFKVVIYKVDFPAQYIDIVKTQSSFLDSLLGQFLSVKTPPKSTQGKIFFGPIKKIYIS